MEGETEMEIRPAAPTVKEAIPENVPETAVMLTRPCPVAVARPAEFTDAEVCGTAYQLAELVRFCVLPSV